MIPNHGKNIVNCVHFVKKVQYCTAGRGLKPNVAESSKLEAQSHLSRKRDPKEAQYSKAASLGYLQTAEQQQ